MMFDELAASVSGVEREILTAVWDSFVQRSRWPSRLRLYRDFTSEAIDSLAARRRPQLIMPRHEGNEQLYQITFAGLLLSKAAAGIEALLTRYLRLAHQRYLQDPETRTIAWDTLRNELSNGVSLSEFLMLLDISGIGYWGGSLSAPVITLPDFVYEIPEHGLDGYIRAHAMRRAEQLEREWPGFLANEPVMEARPDRLRRVWHDPVWSKVIAWGIGVVIAAIFTGIAWPALRPWRWLGIPRSELFYEDQTQQAHRLEGAVITLAPRPADGPTRCWPHVWSTLPGIAPDRFAVCGVWMKRPDTDEPGGVGAVYQLFVDLSQLTQQDNLSCPHAAERPEPPYVVTLICGGGIKQEPTRWVLPFVNAAPPPTKNLKVRYRFEYPKNGRAQASFTLRPASAK